VRFAQVDHDLTIVNEFDQQLGLIKNLVRHHDACSVSSYFMNSFHCFGIINGCLVNGASPFLIRSRLS
jgi:hypothetical protein